MRIYEEKSIIDFEFWDGAKDRLKYFTEADLEIIEYNLNELFLDGIDEVTLNDIFWFEEDFLAELVGYNSFYEIMERGN